MFSYQKPTPRLTPEQVDKLGNAIIYISRREPYLAKTKILKLIYLLEEESVKRYGKPFFNLKYKVWSKGPVSQELFVELSDGPNLLKDFITIEDNGSRGTFFKAKRAFDDSEFTPAEIKLMDLLCEINKGKPGKDLIDLTHRVGSLWYQLAESNNLLKAFEEGASTSDVEMDMSLLLTGDERKLGFYKEFLEMKEVSQLFK